MGKFRFYVFTSCDVTDTKLENHLEFVKAQVYTFISGKVQNEFIYDNDDLYQEGCLAFMYAADTYNPVKGDFRGYAKKVIQHKLYDFWRVITKRGNLTNEFHYNEYENPNNFLDETKKLSSNLSNKGSAVTHFVEDEMFQKFDTMLKRAYENETSKVIRIGLEFLYESAHGNVNARQELIQKYSNLGKKTLTEMEIGKSHLSPEKDRQFTLTSNYISIAKKRAVERLARYGLNEFVEDYLRRE